MSEAPSQGDGGSGQDTKETKPSGVFSATEFSVNPGEKRHLANHQLSIAAEEKRSKCWPLHLDDLDVPNLHLSIAREHISVERVERAKASGSTEIVFKQPNKARITETLTSGVITRGMNGTTVWIQTSKGVNQVTGENLKAMQATPTTTIVSDGLFSPIKIPNSLTRAALIGVATINDREAYLVTIEDSPTQSTQLFFDVERDFFCGELI